MKDKTYQGVTKVKNRQTFKIKICFLKTNILNVYSLTKKLKIPICPWFSV